MDSRLCNLSSEGMLATEAPLNAQMFCRLQRPLSQMLLQTGVGKGFKKLESSCMFPEFPSLVQNSTETDQTHCFPLPVLQLGTILWEREHNTLQVQHSASALPAAPQHPAWKWDNCQGIAQLPALPSGHTASRDFSPKKRLD